MERRMARRARLAWVLVVLLAVASMGSTVSALDLPLVTSTSLDFTSGPNGQMTIVGKFLPTPAVVALGGTTLTTLSSSPTQVIVSLQNVAGIQQHPGDYLVTVSKQGLVYAIFAATVGGAGPVGPAGPPGATGPQGQPGVQGSQGLAGQPGATGPIGPIGPQGLTGANGSQGLQGPAGADGAQGAAGLKGDVGATGAQGFRGDTGATGAQGLKGEKGDTGDIGSIGPAGPEGPQGPAGSNELQNGSATAPALHFASSPATGLYSSATDTLDIATNGVRRITVDASGGIALRGVVSLGGDVWSGGASFIRRSDYNTAVGSSALSSLTVGQRNTAMGFNALRNFAGDYYDYGLNTALGFQAMRETVNGVGNTGVGDSALLNATGNFNTALGTGALGGLITGNQNIAIGVNSAYNTTTGSNNIWLGSIGLPSQSDTIFIGQGQTKTYVAGIYGQATLGASVPVVVDVYGKLATINSSRTVKDDIQDMGAASDALRRLRPVTFRYKEPYADGSRPLQYGLIAEEVAEIDPGLVAYSSTGDVLTVQYHLVNAMLLNEVQKQERQIEAQNALVGSQAAKLADLLERLEALERHKAPDPAR